MYPAYKVGDCDPNKISDYGTDIIAVLSNRD